MSYFHFKCKELSLQTGFNFENINFSKPYSSSDIDPVFSLKYKNHFSEEDLKDAKSKTLFDYSNHILSSLTSLVSYIEVKWHDKIHFNKPKAQPFDFEEQYEKTVVLGSGAFGKVYLVKDKLGKEYALKMLVMDSFVEISDQYTETMVGLLFNNEKLPLLKNLNMYLSTLGKEKYCLNILMTKCEEDILQIQEKLKSSMKFTQFFPIFRDTILGICFMHSKSIAHRDLKPQNILKINNQNRFVIGDYGEGINLTYQEKYMQNEDFMVNNEEGWIAGGTALFLDPMIYKTIQEKKSHMVKGLDLFKADIFSLGLTFIYTASFGGPNSIRGLNHSKKQEKIIYQRIHELTLPIQVKNVILSMTAFDTEQRIPTVSLYQNLKDIMKQLHSNKDILLKNKLITPDQESSFDDLINIKCLYQIKEREKLELYKFNQKILRIAEGNQSYYGEHLKIKEKNNQIKHQKNSIVLVKPVYLPGVFSSEENQKAWVEICGNLKKVPIEDVIRVKSPVFKKNQLVIYFDEKNDSWEFTKILTSDKVKKLYTIQLDDMTLNVNFHSLKLKPILFFQLPSTEQSQEEIQSDIDTFEYFDFSVIPDEKELMTYNTSFFNLRQLFEKSYKLSFQSSDYLKNIFNEIQQYKNKNIFKRIYRFHYGNHKNHEDLMLKVLNHKLYPEMLIQEIDYNNAEEVFTTDVFGEVEHKFSDLESFDIGNCLIKKEKCINKLLNSLSSAKKISKLELANLKFDSNKSLYINDIYRFKNIGWISSFQLLQQFKLYIDDKSQSNIIISVPTVTGIFNALASKCIEYVWIVLSPYDPWPPTEEDIQSLSKALNAFLENTDDFWYFRIELNFIEQGELKFNNFEGIVPFVRKNQKLIDNLPHNYDFQFDIYAKTSDGMYDLQSKYLEARGDSKKIRMCTGEEKDGYRINGTNNVE